MKYVTDIIMGQSPDGNLISDEGTRPFMQGNSEFTERYPKVTKFCDFPNKSSRIGDILMSVRAPVGAVNISNAIYGIGRGLCSIKAINLEKLYLYFTLISAQSAFLYYSNGSTFDAITIDNIDNFFLPIPPIAEQQAIAAYLDHKVGQIDSAVSGINAQIADLKAYRQSVISEAVTRGLDPDAPMKDSGIEWIGKIPQAWDEIKLKYGVKMVLGKMLEDKEPKFNNGEYTLEPYLKSRNVGMLEVYNKIDQVDKMWFNSKEKDIYELKEGDLIMNEGGDIGKVAIWKESGFKCYIQNSVHKLTPHTNIFNHIYLQYLMAAISQKGYFKKIVSSISIAHLTKEKLAETVLLLPPLSEQQAIADYLDEKTEKIDASIKALEAQVADLQALKQSTISEAVTGKVDVRDWKPSDN